MMMMMMMMMMMTSVSTNRIWEEQMCTKSKQMVRLIRGRQKQEEEFNSLHILYELSSMSFMKPNNLRSQQKL
jgi:hypothetical protein